MAEEAIENELNCTICLDTYSDPKILQCFHVYCQKCLVKLVVRDQQRQLSLTCPICRQVTPVPASGTRGLPSDFRVNRFLEILNQHKNVKVEVASTEKVHKESESLPSATCCSEHSGRVFELFCETCGELICYKCAVKGGKHHSHDNKDIQESLEKYKKEVAPLQELLENKMTTLVKTLAQLDKHYDEIAHQRETIETEIRESSKQLHDMISNRQNQLIDKLDQITRRKLKSLATQKDKIETLQAQLSSCLEFTKESLRTEIQQREVLVMKKSVLKQAQELATPSQPDIFTLTIEADVIFSGLAETAAACENHGRVYALDSPDPSKCVAKGWELELTEVERKSTASLQAINFKGEPCSEASATMSFHIELVSEITGAKVLGSVRQKKEHSMLRRGQGWYDISFQPIVKGRHMLHIKADGQHIKGSPLPIRVMQRVEKCYIPILTVTTLSSPVAIAINRKSEIVVFEAFNDCISVLSPCGEKLRSFSIPISCGSRELIQHLGDVTVDGEDNILLINEEHHCIHRFTAEGKHILTVGSEGSGPLQFKLPQGITCSACNKNVYVADTWNHRVQVLTPDLQFIGTFGKEGLDEGQFRYPRCVATDTTGKVYVADKIIHVFTAEGKFLKSFGVEGIGGYEGMAMYELGRPWDIDVDADGFVYVSDNMNHRVAVYTPEGLCKTTFGKEGWRWPESLQNPLGLAVDDTGVVHVCDGNNHRIKLF